jgi:hypothetical protein
MKVFVNCKHCNNGKCNKKDKVFFNLFKQKCHEAKLGIEFCFIADRHPTPNKRKT